MGRRNASRKNLPFDPPPVNGPVCTWSAHPPRIESGLSGYQAPFPRDSHTLTATANAAGMLFLFGGYQHSSTASDISYVFSTRDFSISRLWTSGEGPSPRGSHGAALIDTTLLIYGGKTTHGDYCNLDSLYLLNLGMSDLLMSSRHQLNIALRSSIAKVVPRCGRWSRTRSLLPDHSRGRFQAFRLRW